VLTVGALMVVATAAGGIVGSVLTQRAIARHGEALDARPTPRAEDGGGPREGGPPRVGDARPASTDGAQRARVQKALEAWLEATTRRDVSGRMAFYPPMVPVFYTGRNVPWNVRWTRAPDGWKITSARFRPVTPSRAFREIR
jgi:hypothetical protein